MISRQKLVGWILIVVATAFLVYFVRTRLLTAGLPIEKKEWLHFMAWIILLVLGTMNVRLAAIRERRHKELTSGLDKERAERR